MIIVMIVIRIGQFADRNDLCVKTSGMLRVIMARLGRAQVITCGVFHHIGMGSGRWQKQNTKGNSDANNCLYTCPIFAQSYHGGMKQLSSGECQSKEPNQI